MPTRPSKKRRNQLDSIELARKIVDQAVRDAPKEAQPDSYERKNRAAANLIKLYGAEQDGVRT